MPSAAIPGRLARLVVSTTGVAGSFQPWGGIVDVSMPVNIDALETTDHDSAGARSYIPNHHDVTMSVTGRWLDTDPGQEIVLAAAFDKVSFYFELTMQTVTGRKKFSGSAFPTNLNPSGPLDGTASMDVSLRCSNVLKSTQ